MSRRIAVMQPYLFPYIGYFQLMSATDRIVMLDDVNYINKGWINRNRILVGGKDFTFTVPLKDASQNKLINEIDLAIDEKWRSKFFRTIESAYRKAPFYKEVMPLIESVFTTDEKNLSRFILRSFGLLKEITGFSTEIIPTSAVYGGKELKGQQRIRHICEQNEANEYINPPGGRELYDTHFFEEKNIRLFFLKPEIAPYPQFGAPFVPGLSIIDVLMFNEPSRVKEMIHAGTAEPA